MNLTKNLIAYKTIVRKEVIRVMRIWPQTLIPPVITQTLYFLIFGTFIGSQIRDINGISYIAFIVPGLVMLSVINNSYTNVVSSFFSNKFQRSIEEILVSPTKNWVILCGYMTGGIIRAFIVGSIVFVVSILFTRPEIYSLPLILFFILMTSIVFALGGFLNAIFAKKFDDISIFPTFVLTPLTYLGGIFYSIDSLPTFWQSVSKWNPVLYMINGFRYGFYGFSDVNIFASAGILVVFVVVLSGVNLYALHKGWGMKS